MPFTGKATYSAGVDLPELAEDVADLVSVVSPYETPLLDALGDPARAAQSTLHEWVEDELAPNTDTVNQTTFTPNATDATAITVTNGARFRVGDFIRPGNAREVMAVTAVVGNVLTVVRRHGNSPSSAIANSQRLTIIGSAALEGDDRPDPRFTNRVRRRNWTQIFTTGVEISGTLQASAKVGGVRDEMEYQKQARLREMMRDLENAVINGYAPSAVQQGSASARRSMSGIGALITTNNFTVGSGPIPVGGGAGTELTENVLSAALRQVWENSAGSVDLLLVPAGLKRRINQFLTPFRTTSVDAGRFVDGVSVYESDFGVCRVVLSRWVPADTLFMLDSSRLAVMPLAGRSFFFKPLASTGDRDSGQLIGEYTLEMRNENAHGALRGLT